MTTHVRYAYALALALALAPACGDDGGSTPKGTGADASTTDAGTTSGTSATDAPTTGDPSSTSTAPEAESSTAAAGESSTGEDPFANCRQDVLEEDYFVVNELGIPGAPRWYGPGADDDGNLLDDGQTEFVVSVTYLALKSDADFDALTQLNIANSMALYANSGMVATQLGGSMVCGSLRTFTAWESEAAMMEFVASKAHLQSIGAFSSLSRGGSALDVWGSPVLASEVTLDNAMARLADTAPFD